MKTANEIEIEYSQSKEELERSLIRRENDND